MYGLINVAIRDLVRGRFGDQAWEAIASKAGVDESNFIRMRPNEDAVTVALVGAASDVLDIPASGVLQAFGEYWTEFTGAEGYGDMMDAAGKTLPEFLQNLDNLHTRVGTMYPDLRPPSFRCSHVTEGALDLHYQSDREGLDDLVIGLIRGLGKRFAVDVVITQLTTKGVDSPESVFHVTWT